MRRIAITFFYMGLAACACAEVPTDYQPLEGVADPTRWSPSECDVTASPHAVWGSPAVHMHISVDFHAGEKKHPIGWPRMYLSLKPDEQNWHAYDRFEFQFLTESSRTHLPKHPLIFHLYNAQGQSKLFTLDIAAIGAWRTFSVNSSDLGLTGDISRLGFNINEADYNDKDRIDFHIGGFRLARATMAHVTELKATAPALFCDSRVLPVELVVEGPAEKLAAGVPFQLRYGDRTVLTKTLPVTRGRQIVYLSLKDAKVEPGLYSLIVCPDNPALRIATPLTIVSSPWQ